MHQNGTGIEYPTIELGGRVYTVKFTKGTVYTFQKAGITFAPKLIKNEADPTQGSIQMDIVQLVDVLYVLIGFQGTHEELAELVYDKRDEAMTAIWEARGKAFPLPQPVKLQEPAGKPEAPTSIQ